MKYGVILFLERYEKTLLIPGTEPTTDQGNGTQKSNVMNKWTNWGYSWEYGLRVSYWSINGSKTVVPPKPTPAWWQCTKDAGSSTGWTMSVSGISGGLILFQAACLVWAFSRNWFVREYLSIVVTAYIYLEKKEPSGSGQFQGLPESFEMVFPPTGFNESPC